MALYKVRRLSYNQFDISCYLDDLSPCKVRSVGTRWNNFKKFKLTKYLTFSLNCLIIMFHKIFDCHDAAISLF